MDYKSKGPRDPIQFTDQRIGTGTGALTTFQLSKTYTSGLSPYVRHIKKPVEGTVVVGVNGVQTTNFTVNTTTGVVTMGVAPGNGLAVTAGFQFDVPVRFENDSLQINLAAFDAGEIPDIPIIEVKI